MVYEQCPHCDGSGLQTNTYNGEPDMCGQCKGNTVVPKRNSKGQFMKSYDLVGVSPMAILKKQIRK